MQLQLVRQNKISLHSPTLFTVRHYLQFDIRGVHGRPLIYAPAVIVDDGQCTLSTKIGKAFSNKLANETGYLPFVFTGPFAATLFKGRMILLRLFDCVFIPMLLCFSLSLSFNLIDTYFLPSFLLSFFVFFLPSSLLYFFFHFLSFLFAPFFTTVVPLS